MTWTWSNWLWPWTSGRHLWTQ